jgi:hypothetical protein
MLVPFPAPRYVVFTMQERPRPDLLKAHPITAQLCKLIASESSFWETLPRECLKERIKGKPQEEGEED